MTPCTVSKIRQISSNEITFEDRLIATKSFKYSRCPYKSAPDREFSSIGIVRK